MEWKIPHSAQDSRDSGPIRLDLLQRENSDCNERHKEGESRENIHKCRDSCGILTKNHEGYNQKCDEDSSCKTDGLFNLVLYHGACIRCSRELYIYFQKWYGNDNHNYEKGYYNEQIRPARIEFIASCESYYGYNKKYNYNSQDYSISD